MDSKEVKTLSKHFVFYAILWMALQKVMGVCVVPKPIVLIFVRLKQENDSSLGVIGQHEQDNESYLFFFSFFFLRKGLMIPLTPPPNAGILYFIGICCYAQL